MSEESPILQPVKIGDLELKNRVVMAPLTRSRSSREGVPPPYAADYYAQRASAGLIISEGVTISPQAVGYAYVPGVWSNAQIESWQRVTEAVHANGGKIFLQLWHAGRVSHPSLQPDGKTPVSSSALILNDMAITYEGRQPHVTPRALDTDEIPGIVEDYRKAAENAKLADFDGVEIHSANNYLLEQFVRDSTNKRTDKYGGSVENRLRFPLDVVRAVKDVWGGGKCVGIRISPTTTWPGNTPVDSDINKTYGTYVQKLNEAELLYIHVIEGVLQATRETGDAADYGMFRESFKGAFIDNNNLTLELAERQLAEGKADLFAFGRMFLANPDLVERFATGGPLAEAPREYWFGGNSNGYSDWPTMHGVAKLKAG